MLAESLGISWRRLASIEAGGPIPAEIILALIEVTGVNPLWLLSGEGERYDPPAADPFGRRGPGSHFG
jgi:hypothetical protein